MSSRPALSAIATVGALLLLTVAQLVLAVVEGDSLPGMIVVLGSCAIGFGILAQKRWAWGLAVLFASHAVAWAWSWWSWERPSSEILVNASLVAVSAVLVASLVVCPVVGGKGVALVTACGALIIAISVVAVKGALLPAYSSVFFADAADWWRRTHFQSRLTGVRFVLLAWACYLLVVTARCVGLRVWRRRRA